MDDLSVLLPIQAAICKAYRSCTSAGLGWIGVELDANCGCVGAGVGSAAGTDVARPVVACCMSCDCCTAVPAVDAACKATTLSVVLL